MTIETVQGNWSKVPYGKKYGWVSSSYLTKVTTSTPTITSVTQKTGYVTVDQLNVRQSASSIAKSIAKVNKGTSVTILSNSGSWSKITIPSLKLTGWVASSYITDKAPIGTPTIPPQKTGYVTVDQLNVRQSASSIAKSIAKVNKGTSVTILSNSGSWSKITIPSLKLTGWVASSYITDKAPIGTPTIPPQKTGYVTVDQLNVRQSASSLAKSIAKVNKGTSVTILSNSGSWSKITIPSLKLTGWVASSYITDKAPIGTPTIPPQKTGYVTVDQLNVRQSASSLAKSIAKVNKGTSVTILSKSGSWSKITIPSLKLTGWVASSYITDKASIVTSPDSEFKKTLTGKTIVIDAGHGGKDPGTSGKIYLEKTLNLETAKELALILRSAGAKVVMTRETDVYLILAKRVQVSHENNADVFISVHYNATSNTSINGVDTFYWTTHANEKKLAENIQQEVIKETGLKNRGVLTGNFQVIRDNKNAAVLVELGFLSNEQEERKVASKDYQIKAATGIYNGLIRYFAK